MQLSKKRRIRLVVISIISLLILILLCFFIFIVSVFYVDKPNNDRFIFLFEEYTQTKYPKSGEITKKYFDTGLNDGVEAVVIKVNDSIEFKVLKKEIQQKSFMIFRTKEQGFGSFYSDIFRDEYIDSLLVNKNDATFRMAFTKNGNKIIYEKSW